MEITKRIAMVIVVLKSNFSNPRRVWLIAPPSPPPKAPPTPALDCCSSMIATRIKDNTI